MTANDLDLLRQYAAGNSEEAFAALVNRHLNLVYSSALRQVRSPELAEEVAQSVFNDLARNAAKLKPDTILSAWLYQVARRTAIDLVRKEARRQLRERVALEMTAMNSNVSDWTQVEPLLDEAMAALEATDRLAILLRYFENKSLRDIGQALGTTDDAAQKRVSRAIERLRDFFTRRGVSVAAGGLAAVISANAVQAAPAGLAASITAAALSAATITTAALIAATKTIAMTTLQKTIAASAVAVLVGAGVYEARQAANARAEMQTLQQRQTEQLEQMQRNADETARQLTALHDDNERLNRDTSELLRLRREIGELRRQTNNSEELRKENAQLRDLLDKAGQAQQTPKDRLPTSWRQQASRVAGILTKSVLMYAAQNHGQLPTSVSEASGFSRDTLQPDPNLQDESALAESAKLFELVFQGSNEGITNAPNMILIRETAPRQRADGMYERAYGFADGHAEVWVNPDGNYSEKETKRPTYNDTNTSPRLQQVISR